MDFKSEKLNYFIYFVCKLQDYYNDKSKVVTHNTLHNLFLLLLNFQYKQCEDNEKLLDLFDFHFMRVPYGIVDIELYDRLEPRHCAKLYGDIDETFIHIKLDKNICDLIDSAIDAMFNKYLYIKNYFFFDIDDIVKESIVYHLNGRLGDNVYYSGVGIRLIKEIKILK